MKVHAAHTAFIQFCSTTVAENFPAESLTPIVYLLRWMNKNSVIWYKQESPAIADKPARRESLPKISPIRSAYNVVADNTGLSSFV